MATLSKKPGSRFAITDWIASTNNISTNSERQRMSSHDVRQETRALVNGKLYYCYISGIIIFHYHWHSDASLAIQF